MMARWRVAALIGVWLVGAGCKDADGDPSPSLTGTPTPEGVGSPTEPGASPSLPPSSPTDPAATTPPTEAPTGLTTPEPTSGPTAEPPPTGTVPPPTASASPTSSPPPEGSPSPTLEGAPSPTPGPGTATASPPTAPPSEPPTGLPSEAPTEPAGPTSPTDGDGDGFVARQDCDDGDPQVYPGAPESCDGVDEDCDGRVDDGFDGDGDTVCDVDDVCPGSDDRVDTDVDGVPNGCDVCADADDHVDSDGDGLPDGCDACEGFEDTTDADGDTFTVCEECDDGDPLVFPGAGEVCNGTDDDCDGFTDDEDSGLLGGALFYADGDEDTYGDPATSTRACAAPAGYVANDDDCDDSDPELNPTTTWYLDYDGDGYGDPRRTWVSCTSPPTYVRVAGDCDDLDEGNHPGAVERCDGEDNNCDGQIDEDGADPSPFYLDGDGDGYGDPSQITYACAAPDGYVENQGDCDDGAEGISPSGEEVCDQLDNNCDGAIDEGFDTTTLWPDADGDGFGDEDGQTVESCVGVVPGYTTNFGDCDDSRDDVYPDAPDYTDPTLDSDCDGIADDCSVSPMVGHWRFNESTYTGASGEVLDYSCAGNHARSVGALVSRELSPTCRHTWFDGLPQGGAAVRTPIAVNQTASSPGYVIMAWVYPETTPSECAYYNCGRHMVISSDTGGYDWSLLREYNGWNIFTGCDTWYTGVQVEYGEWHHIAAVFDPTSATEPVRFYYDGVKRGTYPTYCQDADVDNFTIGDNPAGFTEYWKGYLDEVRIYVGPLATGEVQAAMEESRPCALDEGLPMP